MSTRRPLFALNGGRVLPPGLLEPGRVPASLIARVFGLLYVAGPVVALVAVALPGSGRLRSPAVVLVAVTVVATGALLLSHRADRAPVYLFSCLQALATAALTVGCLFAGLGRFELLFFFLWATPYVWCFFPTREAVAQTALVLVAIWVALAAQESVVAHPARAGTEPVLGVWLITAATVVAVGGLTRWLVSHLQTSGDWLRQGFELSPLGLVMSEPGGRIFWANDAFARMLGRGAAELVGRELTEFVVPAERATVAAVFAAANPPPQDTYVRRMLHRSGREVLVEVHRAVINSSTGDYRFAQVRDVTDERLAQLDRDRLVALVEATDELIAMATLDGRLTYLNATGRRLLGINLEEAEQTITGVLDAAGAARFRDVLLPRMLAGEVVFHRIDIPTASGELIPFEGSSFAIADEAGGPPTVLATVMRDQRQSDRAREELEFVHEQRRRLLAELVTAAETERHRIARDVHDDSVQVLAALDIRLQLLQRHLGRDRARVEEVQALRGMTAAANARLRALIFDLEPTTAGASLAEAVRNAGLEIFRATDVSLEVHYDVDDDPSEEIVRTVYRVVREALVNVRKHAVHARAVRVTIVARSGTLAVGVEDDGQGADVDARGVAGHLGVVSMRERTELSGGTFNLGPSPLGGLQVTVQLPLV